MWRYPLACATSAITTPPGAVSQIIASISDRWEWLHYVTIFSAYAPQKAMAAERVEIISVAVMLVVGAVGLVAAAVVFRRKDVAA